MITRAHRVAATWVILSENRANGCLLFGPTIPSSAELNYRATLAPKEMQIIKIKWLNAVRSVRRLCSHRAWIWMQVECVRHSSFNRQLGDRLDRLFNSASTIAKERNNITIELVSINFDGGVSAITWMCGNWKVEAEEDMFYIHLDLQHNNNRCSTWWNHHRWTPHIMALYW